MLFMSESEFNDYGKMQPFDPHPAQLEIIEAYWDYRFRVLNCGRRFGKTLLAINEMLSYAYFNDERKDKPFSLTAYVAPTITQARDIAWRLLKASGANYGGFTKVNEARLEVTLNGQKGPSEIWLRGMENYESLRGLGINFLVVDEVAMIRNWRSAWEEVLRATLTDTEGKVLLCSTPRGYNHWYDLWCQGQQGNEKQLPNWKSWSFPSWTNPHLKQTEIDGAKAELVEDAFWQEWGAVFKRFTGLVYKDFDRDKHVVDAVEPKNFVYWLAGHDPGFHNPRAFALIGVDSDGVWYQVDELYMPGITNPQFKEECLRILSKWNLNFEDLELATMDSAHQSDIAELADLGMSFIPVKKASGEVRTSYVRYKIDRMSERIRSGRFYVMSNCRKTIWEFENYSWPKTKDEHNADESPSKLNDHMMDVLGDLNSMYIHLYEIEKKPIWYGKAKGSYVPPANEELIDDNDWLKEGNNDEWDDIL
jgi:hypothetical protein